MDDRLKAHARSFDTLDWESFPEGKQVHAYAETVVTETSTLHNVLKRYLSPMVVEVPIQSEFRLIKDDHGRSICKLHIPFIG